jgi:hypothetical protein
MGNFVERATERKIDRGIAHGPMKQNLTASHVGGNSVKRDELIVLSRSIAVGEEAMIFYIYVLPDKKRSMFGQAFL